jgi:hypothetical protein
MDVNAMPAKFGEAGIRSFVELVSIYARQVVVEYHAESRRPTEFGVWHLHQTPEGITSAASRS